MRPESFVLNILDIYTMCNCYSCFLTFWPLHEIAALPATVTDLGKSFITKYLVFSLLPTLAAGTTERQDKTVELLRGISLARVNRTKWNIIWQSRLACRLLSTFRKGHSWYYLHQLVDGWVGWVESSQLVLHHTWVRINFSQLIHFIRYLFGSESIYGHFNHLCMHPFGRVTSSSFRVFW